MKALFYICLIIFTRKTEGFTACNDGTTGANSPSSFATSTTTVGKGYLMEDESYQATCCGFISAWEFVASGSGTVVLQIWRKIGTHSYKLVGKNTVTATTGPNSVTINLANRIPIQHGDYIGWYSSPNVVMHATGTGYPITNWYSATITDLAVGTTHDWTADNVVGTEMKFAIKATMTASTVPSFTFGTSTTVSITDDTAADTNILPLSVTDESLDTLVYSTYATDNYYFYVDDTNGQIKTFQANIPEGTYSISPMVTDACYNTATAVVTVTVSNVPITLNGFSAASASISESEYTEINLTRVLITEPNDGYYCYLTSNPTYPFYTRQESSLYADYSIYLQYWPQLDYDTTTSYNLVIECKEATGAAPVTVTGTFSVNILRNAAPILNVTHDTVTVNAKTDYNGKVIYTVGVTDPENDPLTMTLSTTGPFLLTDDGRVVLTSNVIHHTTQSAYTLTISVTDSDAHSLKTMTLDVNITNINTAPTITNLDATISVTENEALAKSVFQVTVPDPDGDTIEYYAQFNPSYGSKLFTLDSSTGIVYTSSSKNIDYDVISNHLIEIYVTASDGKYYDTKTLKINITNVNEPPVISQSYFRIERDEGLSGATFPTSVYDVNDPDVNYAGDSFSFSKNCGAHDSLVSMATSTGQFSFNGDYDLDTGSKPTDFSCTVTVTDLAGATGICVIDVHVNYVNEFTPTFGAASYTATVLYTELVGNVVLTALATDSDLGDDGKFYYEIIDSENLFGVLQNGSVFLNSDLLRASFYPNAHTDTMILKAVDTGGRSSTAQIVITIPVAASVLIDQSSDRPWTFFEYPINMLVYEIVCVVALICLCVAVYLAWKYASFQMTRINVAPAAKAPAAKPAPKLNGHIGGKTNKPMPSNQQSINEEPDTTDEPAENGDKKIDPKMRVPPLFQSGSPRPADSGTYARSPPPPVDTSSEA